MPTSCCCGNLLDGSTVTRIRVSPCSCDEPGPGASMAGLENQRDPRHLSRRQIDQRERLGLPVMSPAERAAMVPDRWV